MGGSAPSLLLCWERGGCRWKRVWDRTESPLQLQVLWALSYGISPLDHIQLWQTALTVSKGNRWSTRPTFYFFSQKHHVCFISHAVARECAPGLPPCIGLFTYKSPFMQIQQTSNSALIAVSHLRPYFSSRQAKCISSSS